MTYLITSPARDSEVLEFWRSHAQWQRAAADALKAYLS